MKDSEVLRAAADIVDQAFCKDAYAKDKEGRRVDVMSPTAIGFCMLGAMARVLGGSVLTADRIIDHWVAHLIPQKLIAVDIMGGNHVHRKQTARDFNDDIHTSNTAVAGLLREGAKAAEAKGS